MKVGKRLLEVNGQSMLGATHQEAVRALRQAGHKMQVMVCNGYTMGTDSPSLSKSMSSLDREDDEYLRIQQVNLSLSTGAGNDNSNSSFVCCCINNYTGLV